MKRYTINVHYDAMVTVVVDAPTEEAAPYKAEDISLETAEIGDINCCVTDVEDI